MMCIKFDQKIKKYLKNLNFGLLGFLKTYKKPQTFSKKPRFFPAVVCLNYYLIIIQMYILLYYLCVCRCKEVMTTFHCETTTNTVASSAMMYMNQNKQYNRMLNTILYRLTNNRVAVKHDYCLKSTQI